MVDTAPAAVPKTKTPKKKTSTKPKVAASHPTYSDMLQRSIKALKERKGSSKQAILKYIMANFNVGADPKSVNNHLKMALKRAVASKVLKQTGGTGAQGRFRVGDEAKEKVKAAPKKATTTKKPKSPTKKVASKAKKEKSPKKVAAPKKAKSPKKPKAVVKKPTSPKKAAKPAAKKAKKVSPKKATRAKK